MSAADILFSFFTCLPSRVDEIAGTVKGMRYTRSITRYSFGKYLLKFSIS